MPDENVPQRALDEVQRVIVGQRETLTLMMAALLARGHVLLNDLPGTGKTLTARTLAVVLGLDFGRVQFTPDLMPSDVTGSSIFDQRAADFVFQPGPIFTGLLLADEINRTPPKTQAALLEAMQEGQVTVNGQTYRLPSPFHVVATANPLEQEGTYPLPEAQLDRFLVRLRFGYVDAAAETEVVVRQLELEQPAPTVEPVFTPAALRAWQARTDAVHVARDVVEYAVALTRASRSHHAVAAGSSPRGALALIACARGLACIEGRSFVTPSDVQRLAGPALEHRIVLRPELWLTDVTSADVVADVLGTVAVPDMRS